MILVVDDQTDNVYALKKVLESNKIETDVASSGLEALRKILKNDYELIILDVQMPDMDGFEVAETINGLRKVEGLPIIFFSSVHTNKKYLEEGFNKGAWDYLIKPFDTYVLVYKIRSAIAHYRQTLLLKNSQKVLLDEVEKLKQSDATKEEFISIAGHELSTPITSINGYLQLALRTAKNGKVDQTISLLNKGLNQINKLNRLTRDLLDSSRLQSGKMEYNFTVFNCKDFLKTAIENVKYSYPDRKISYIPEHEVWLEGDQQRLEQVLINYLTNALKYSAPDSEVVVYTAINEGRFLKVCVKDFGPGIDSDKQRYIFHKYYRVKEGENVHQGLGMGLFICSQIISAHQGKFGLESKIGKGSVFYFVLPIKAQKKTSDISAKNPGKRNHST